MIKKKTLGKILGVGAAGILVWNFIPNNYIPGDNLKPGRYELNSETGTIRVSILDNSSGIGTLYQDNGKKITGIYSKTRTNIKPLNTGIDIIHGLTKGRIISSGLTYMSVYNNGELEGIYKPFKEGCNENCQKNKSELEQKIGKIKRTDLIQ